MLCNCIGLCAGEGDGEEGRDGDGSGGSGAEDDDAAVAISRLFLIALFMLLLLLSLSVLVLVKSMLNRTCLVLVGEDRLILERMLLLLLTIVCTIAAGITLSSSGDGGLFTPVSAVAVAVAVVGREFGG